MDDYKQEAYKELARRELERRQLSQNKEPEGWFHPGWGHRLLKRAGEDVEQHINKPVEQYIKSPIESGLRAAGGFAQGTANILPGIANLGISGINALGGNVPHIPMLDVVPHGPAETTGNIASFFSGPGLLKAPLAAKGISALGHIGELPEVANAFNKVAKIIAEHPRSAKTAESAILGGAYAPENPLQGMGLGVLGGLAGEGLSKVFNYVKEAPTLKAGLQSIPSRAYEDIQNSLDNSKFIQEMYKKYSPSLHHKEIEHLLSGGLNNAEEVGKSLNQDIFNAYKGREAQAQPFFQHVTSKAGHEPIYENENVWLGTPHEGEKTFNQLENLGLGDIFDIFKKNPTLANAHKLKGQIGSMIGDLKGTYPRPENFRIKLGKLNNAYETINSDVLNYLKKRDSMNNESLAPVYQRGVDLWREHVAPYLNNKKIVAITQHGKTNVKNLHSAFGHPSDIRSPEGQETIGDINKIMQDLPQNAQNKILFSAIGGNKEKPEEFLKSLLDLKNKGYGSYISPELEKHMSLLGSKIETAKKIKKIPNTLGRSALGYEAAKTIKKIL